MSIPRHQATKAPAEGRGSAPATDDGAEAKRGNRAQLIGAAAVAFVLIGTTAFVLLRDTGSPPPPQPPEAAVQPAPQAPQPSPLPAQPAPPPAPAAAEAPPPPAPPVASTPAVAPPRPAETQPAAPPALAPPAPEPTEAEAKPASKHHKRVKAEGSADIYTLQLDSFLVPENAKALVGRLNAHGGSAYEKAEPGDDGKTWHKVRLGAYDSQTEAEAAAADLKQSEGLDALIVRTTPDDGKADGK